MSIYQDTRDAINAAARAVAAGTSEFSSADIREWIIRNRAADWPRFAPSFQSHFSYAVNTDGECVVERVPGKFLYRLTVPAPEVSPSMVTENAVAPSDAAGATQLAAKVQREAKLYAVLREWLETKGYQAEVTAASKVGGMWGNPDVTGLRLEELPIGPVGVECATIEAKLSADSWRYYIFEAVAHKRFAHRAWFAFAIGTDSPTIGQVKDAEQLAEYAEKYRIGILVVFISTNQYVQLTSGDASVLTLSPDDVRIVSWFSVNWNLGRLALASGEGHPAVGSLASCQTGFSLSC